MSNFNYMEESSTIKQQKVEFDVRNEENNFSRLPDAILHHVLSFLPTKHAVATSVLSWRWRYLWVSTPNLCFDDTLVNRTTFIKKFVLKCMFDHDASKVNAWICAAIVRNVEELDVHLAKSQYRSAVYLPTNLFYHEMLSILKLHGQIRFPSSFQVYLPNLKICHFKSLKFLPNDCLGKVLSGCPVLVEFVIHEAENRFTMLEMQIRSNSMKSLSIYRPQFIYYRRMGRKALVIDAPNLELLDVKDYGSEEFEVSMFPLLVKATIDVRKPHLSTQNSYQYGLVVNPLIRKIAKVKDLRLSCSTNNALCVVSKLEIPTFHNLTRLDIRGGDVGTNILPRLLEYSLNLEIIILDKLRHDKWDMEDYIAGLYMSSLKTIEFLKLTASPSDMEIVKFFLKNAASLKKVIIHADKVNAPGPMEYLFIASTMPKECEVTYLPWVSVRQLVVAEEEL